MDGDKNVRIASGELPEEPKTVMSLLKRAAVAGTLEESELSDEEIKVISGISKKRGASDSPFKLSVKYEVVYKLTGDGIAARRELIEKDMTGDEIGSLTPELIASGEWKGKSFRGYSVNTAPVRVLLGRRNPYGSYLQWVKDKLVSLGFEEFDGPLVETEFWNGDALFMPQFHSARDIHDVYYVKKPSHAKEIEQPWLDRIAGAHENGGETESRGWGYSFDRDFTRRLVMRSQGTVLSAKQLTKASIPGKYFGMARCFRYDQVDATHGADFYQTEGIVLGEDVNLKTLLGLLKMFAEEVAGAEEVRYVPGYFPFTEPSIEVHIKHPILGWFELGGSGIFRPEVTESLGVNVPVLAWGLGIDRMALMHLGLNDLRELFSSDIENVRLGRSK
jgi:phenylalanyl-tRNA synthetase alpha chain